MRTAATTAASGRRSVDLLIGLIGGDEPRREAIAPTLIERARRDSPERAR